MKTLVSEIKAEAQRAVGDFLDGHREDPPDEPTRRGVTWKHVWRLTGVVTAHSCNHVGCGTPVNSHPDDATVCGEHAPIAR